jgi:hypothetical protein
MLQTTSPAARSAPCDCCPENIGVVPIAQLPRTDAFLAGRHQVRDHQQAAEAFVRETVSHKVSLLATDQSRVYHGLTDYPHGTVDHGIRQYVGPGTSPLKK